MYAFSSLTSLQRTRPWAVLALMTACLPSLAAGGLLPPTGNDLWHSLRARIAIQTVAVSPLLLAGLSSNGQGLQGGAVLGDYVFAEPAFGSFRATSGIILGQQGQAPSFGAPIATGHNAADSRLGLSVDRQTTTLLGNAAMQWQAAPYVGLGYSSSLGDSSFSLSADLGLMAESIQPGTPALRTPLGVQGSDIQRRELRLSPVLQFGMRYTF